MAFLSLHRYFFVIALLLGMLSASLSLGKNEPEGFPFAADELIYDEQNKIITAIGHVEIAYGAHILQADKIIYNEVNKTVVAFDNIRIIEPTGEVIYADYFELSEDLSKGFVDNIRILLSDNARIVAVDGERFNGKITRLNKAVYSPCNLCETDPLKPPLWQIKSKKVIHDKESHNIYYRNASIEMKGFPVLFTPYFSHPDPTVKRRSGFLTPVFGGSSELGPFMRAYYYYDFMPNMDFTLEGTVSKKNKVGAGAQWRHRLDSGLIETSGSIARTERFTGTQDNKHSQGQRNRGHIFSKGGFDINNHWRWGFDVNRTTDDTYLKTYQYGNKEILNSKVFAERFSSRGYSKVDSYAFQDLRAQKRDEPVVLPWMYNSAYFEPEIFPGGRYQLESEFVAISRRPGADSHRASINPSWQRKDIYDLGLVSTVDLMGRADGYVSDLKVQPNAPTIRKRNVKVLRGFSQAEAKVSYPLAREFKVGSSSDYQQTFEPIIGYAAAPNVGKNAKIPNEDSLDFEFDVNNLFVPNKFAGVDLLEGGQRARYGFKTGFFNLTGGKIELYMGQSYRLREDRTFPKGTGLDSHFSDVVGTLNFEPSKFWLVNYDFRLDNHDFSPNKHYVNSQFGPERFKVTLDYLFLDQKTVSNVKDIRQEVIYGATYKFADHWALHSKTKRKLGSKSNTIASELSLTYDDECFKFVTAGKRDFTRRSGKDRESLVYFQIFFKTLGMFETPKFNI